MPNSWSVRIIELPDGTAAFLPDLPRAVPGQTLGVEQGDNVTWNNQTNEAHWPVADDLSFITNNIPPGEVSDPIFNLSQKTTVTYFCRHHPQEKGSIQVI